ncbi:hypothetical protein A0H81_04520 [Grifola frondosa]|uniref:Protein kinase domain-containing protein n=1 Tax=Grifola frondosa TaxID=5627 RepID=A0A1C7MF13_GRIFR|nr:hypothetical protein A0H81_04520 [Grifola frondosa]
MGLSAAQGCGGFQGGPGPTLGPRGRYKLRVKLGFGSTASSVWLVWRVFIFAVDDAYVAAEILTGYVSHVDREHELRELEILQQHSLSDFSDVQFVSDQTTDDITPLGLRPPEVILGGGKWDESLDIWTFGCIYSCYSLIDPTPRAPAVVAMASSGGAL